MDGRDTFTPPPFPSRGGPASSAPGNGDGGDGMPTEVQGCVPKSTGIDKGGRTGGGKESWGGSGKCRGSQQPLRQQFVIYPDAPPGRRGEVCAGSYHAGETPRMSFRGSEGSPDNHGKRESVRRSLAGECDPPAMEAVGWRGWDQPPPWRVFPQTELSGGGKGKNDADAPFFSNNLYYPPGPSRQYGGLSSEAAAPSGREAIPRSLDRAVAQQDAGREHTRHVEDGPVPTEAPLISQRAGVSGGADVVLAGVATPVRGSCPIVGVGLKGGAAKAGYAETVGPVGGKASVSLELGAGSRTRTEGGGASKTSEGAGDPWSLDKGRIAH